MEGIQEAAKQIEESKKIVILSHRSPDGDSIGSSLAVWNYLKEKGIAAKVITPDPAPDFLSWMQGFDEINNYENHPERTGEWVEEADLIFCLDFNDPSRTGDLTKHLVNNSKAFKINIDHHQDPKDFCNLAYVDSTASSTAELVYNFIAELKDESLLNKAIAECIYTGILTDTGSFRFSSTSAKTHLIASKMMQLGVMPEWIHRMVYDSYSAERLKLLGYSLYKSLRLLENNRIAIIPLDAKELSSFNFKRGDTEGLVNYPLSIKSVQVSILLTEKDGMIKMSFRSKGEIGVNEFAGKYFKGGGHINAAGGVSFDGMEATIQKLESHISDLL